MTLYHASNHVGLKVLLPQLSIHGTPYVYAVKNKLTAVLFGAPKDDFDILMDEQNGKPVLWECYPDALRTVYCGKSCALYEVKDTGFLSGRTGWEQELVSLNPVTVIRETMIDDIYRVIIQATGNGECILHRYSLETAYQEMLRNELMERIEMFGLTKEHLRQDMRFQTYFSSLL